MCVYIYIYMYVCMCVYIYIHQLPPGAFVGDAFAGDPAPAGALGLYTCTA